MEGGRAMSGVNKINPARKLNRLWLTGCCVVLSLLSLSARSENKFQDVLDVPAQMRHALTKVTLLAIVPAGPRLVAVGSRGIIIVSDDQGKTWLQSQVPVQSDLLSVQFPTASDGWAVGHDGVVLHTADGGKTWVKQLDGRIAGAAFTKFYTDMGPAGEAELRTMGVNYKAGAALPILDVWFEDTQTGYGVGSYGMLIATHDGGKSWEPWLHRIDNKERLNLNAVRGIGKEIYIVGERGLVFQLDRSRGYFTKTATGSAGSFFGIAGNGDVLVTFGLRGVVYRQENGKPWEAVSLVGDQTTVAGIASSATSANNCANGCDQTITAGIARSDGEGFVLVNAAGNLILGDKTAKSFRLLPPSAPMRMTGLVELKSNTYLVTGLEGYRTEAVSDAQAAPR